MAKWKTCAVLLLAAVCGWIGTAAAGPGDAADAGTRLLRYPDVHGDVVVFVYGGDVWRAPVAGGVARRLTAHPGLELFPKISRDGRWVAYTAESTGNRQVYVMPIEGGEPRQLTFYGDVGPMPPRGGWDYWIQDWMPDGRILVRMNRTPWGPRMGRYYLVDPEGGLEEPLPLPEGGGASPSPDGRKLAYCPISREFRTWKRHRGGRAQDIWIFDFGEVRSQRITRHRGTDNFPMWHGRRIYFTSDRDGILNLFAYDLETETLRQLTEFDTFDVLWPSLGPEAIVFMHDGLLKRFDLRSEAVTTLPIQVRSELPHRLPRHEPVADEIRSAELSPSGARVVFEARGELFTVPAEHGPTRNLSRSPETRERAPAWSPDGAWMAYLSDASGEYELYRRRQDGTGEPEALTRDGGPWKFAPRWSPDGRMLAYGDRGRKLWILDVTSGRTTEVDRGRRGDLDTVRWSPDSRWLAYETWHPSGLPALGLYSLDQERKWILGDGLTMDFQPEFSADGTHLFFLSNRDFNIRFSDFEFNYVYDRATRIYALQLNPEGAPLFPTRSDEETGPGEKPSPTPESGEKPKGRKHKADDKDPKKRNAAPVTPPETGDAFRSRTVALPGLEAGDYRRLVARKGFVYFLETSRAGRSTLRRYDLDQRKVETVANGVNAFDVSRDGKKLLLRTGSGWSIVPARAGVKPAEGRLNLDALEIRLDPAVEWRQMYRDAWRIVRDWFYDPAMHGKDWKAIGDRYARWLPWTAHRSDLDFIFGELIGELEAGHTYVNAGDEPRPQRVETAKLGCTFAADPSGFYRIDHIFPGENWDPSTRSPLTEPSSRVEEGEFLFAVDEVPLRVPENPYRLLEGKADQEVVLQVGATPDPSKARRVTVRPIASEQGLRYLEWVRGRMVLVERLSGGRVGYIHLPNTSFEGNRMLQKLFYGQANKDALIIDDRYNGGGFIPDRMIEMLSRTTLAYWARRGVEAMKTPAFAHDGPKVMLINAYSSSGGDALPYFFRKLGLGPLIGTRTWGGLIGLTGNPDLMDGGGVLVPTFRIYDTEGRWVVENEGVAPDMEVVDLPERILAGGDPSLEAGVRWLLEALEREPVHRPEPPAPPAYGSRP